MTRFALVFGPGPSLVKAIKESKTEGWFKGVILSAVYLEHYGYLKLRKHMDSLKLEYRSEDLKSLTLPSIALMLYTVGKIGKPEYETMVRINVLRNKVIHRREKRKTLFGKEADREIRPLVEDTLRILKEFLNAMTLRISKY